MGTCVKWNTFFTVGRFPPKFPKFFSKWKMPLVSWFHGFRGGGFIGFFVFHGFMGFIQGFIAFNQGFIAFNQGFVVSWVSWFCGFLVFMGFVVS